MIIHVDTEAKGSGMIIVVIAMITAEEDGIIEETAMITEEEDVVTIGIVAITTVVEEGEVSANPSASLPK